MKILIKGKVETVSLDRVKPAHFECELATGTTTQRTTPSKRTSSKTTGNVRRDLQDPLAPSSTHTQRSNRTSVKPTTTKSKATKHGTNLATAPQQKAIRVKLPNKFKPYVAPHSRTPAVSRANGSYGGLRMYSCVPLHLRGKTPPTRTTRVGRTIQTPARFVQMVHAIVAPNNIYGGTNRTYRSNNSHNL